MTAAELIQLLRCGKGMPGFYVYDPGSRVARTPDLMPNVRIAWPIEFVARYHVKHVFEMRKSPSLTEVGRALAVWEHKTRWKLHYSLKAGGDDDRSNSSWWHLEDPRCRQTHPCSHPIPKEWEDFFSLFRETVFEQCVQSRSRLMKYRARISNLNGCANLGLKLLSHSPWCLAPTDKDGGYALTERAALKQAIQKSMAADLYSSAIIYDGGIEAIVEDYRHLVDWVVDVTRDAELARALLSSIRRGNRRLVCSILCTVKTHKPDGEVGLRILHSSVKHMFVPAMKYISHLLRPAIQSIPALVRDSDDLIAKMSQVVVPSTAMMMKFDIKEFYMSGDHQTICEAVGAFFPANLRLCMTELTRFILDHQFVCLPDELEWFKVLCGAGMGLSCAGDLADLTFHSMVEKSWLLLSATWTNFNIVAYFRFRDDGLYILDCDRTKRLEFASLLKRHAGCFKVQFEVASFDSINMLDVEFFRGERWQCTGVLDHKLFRKESSQWTPLLPASFHNPAIHIAWPRAQLQRIRRRHSNEASAARDQMDFCNRYLQHTGSSVDLFPRTPRIKLPVLLPRLVLPFRVEWQAVRFLGLARSCWQELGNEWDSNSQLLQVSWRLSNRHLLDLIRSFMYGGAWGR